MANGTGTVRGGPPPNDKNAGGVAVQESSYEADVVCRSLGARCRRTGTRCRPSPGGPAPRAPATYVPTTAPVYNWGGVYIGINGGYGFGQSNWTDPVFGPTGNFTVSGGLVGGTIGANFQANQFVFGVEADMDWADLDGTTNNTCTVVACETKSDWLGTVRGRAGWAWDRILFYGTGGVAFGDVKAGFSGSGFDSAAEVGWTAGVGMEYAFTENFTGKIEYLFVDLGNSSCPVASCFGGGATTVSLNENIVRAGVNFKFNGF